VVAMGKGRVGGAMGGNGGVISPAAAARTARYRKWQEAQWAKKSGAVTITYKPGREPKTT
jgi:hypothetical protein